MIYIGSVAKSGTHFITEFLNRLGLQVGHEFPERDGLVTWYTFHSPRHFPCEVKFNVDGAICLHQVRHPLDTISSLVYLDQESWKYVRAVFQDEYFLHIPILKRSMSYYYHWHKWLEDCTFDYQVEHPEQLLDILDLFEVEYDKSKIPYALETPRLGSTPNKKQLKWKDLWNEDSELTTDIYLLAQKYGYNY